MEKKPENNSDVLHGFPEIAAGNRPFTAARSGLRKGITGVWRLFGQERRCQACTCIFAVSNAEGSGEVFCPECARLLRRREKGYCPGCGEPTAWPDLPLAPCMRCLESPPLWDTLFFHSLHQGLLQQLLLKFKFHGQIALAPALGGLLARHPGLIGMSFDCVVPIPLHESRLSRRGYNQALELAKPLCARLGLPCEPDLLKRVRATDPQTGVCLADRKKNTRGAFAGSSSAKSKRILLLDDTVTTGSTMTAAAAALRDAGAVSVAVAAVSRTPRLM